MSQPADVPRKSDINRPPEVCIVQEADAELQSYVQQLLARRNPELGRAGKEAINATHEAAKEWSKDNEERSERSAQIEQGTREANAVTTSEIVDPATQEAPRTRTRKKDRSR